MTAPTETLGSLLKTLRKNCGVSLRELSVLLDVSHTYVATVERASNPSPSYLETALKTLKADYDTTAKAWRLLGRLPPGVVDHLLNHPELWLATHDIPKGFPRPGVVVRTG